MGMRVTTGMAMNTYRYNLQNSTRNMNNSRNTVLTQRKFNSFGEAPAAATQAWRLRRSIVNMDVYQSNNDDTYTRFNIAWAALGQASYDLTDRDGRKADIYAASDPTASGRNTLGLVLRETAASVVQTMNSAKSGEHYLFSGDDELYAPFTWDGDKLLYRGVDVNSGQVRMPTEDPVPKYWGEIDPDTGMPCKMPTKITNAVDEAWYDYYTAKAAYDKALAEDPNTTVQEPVSPATWAENLNGITAKPADDYDVPMDAYDILNDPNADPMEKAWAEYYVDQGNKRKLEAMSREQIAIDLGMGMREDENGGLISGTYFDRSLPGINMLGFGIDEDGDPKNVCMIMMRLGEIYENCHAETGSYDKNDPQGGSMKAKALREEAMRLLDKLKAGQDHVTGQYVEVNTKASFLEQNQGRLDLQAASLTEQLVNIEHIDPADAITQFMWDYNCYSAALKVGTQLLSQSLIDYMT